jgi:excisionase family DNA binding protein
MRTLLTVKEVAAYLHASKTVHRLCALGELRHIRVLNAITMTPSDVDALVFARRV